MHSFNVKKAAVAAVGIVSCLLMAVNSPASADPAPFADPVLCQLAPPSGTNPQTGAIVGGTGTPRGGRAGGKGTVTADLKATCYSNQDVFFRYRITRERDGRTFDGSAWLRLTGADCVRPSGCTRMVVTAGIGVGGNNTGNDSFKIQFLDAAGNVSGTAGVYPTTLFPRVGIPSEAPLQNPEIISSPAVF